METELHECTIVKTAFDLRHSVFPILKMAAVAAHIGVTNPPNPTCVTFLCHPILQMADEFIESTLECPTPLAVLRLAVTYVDV